MMYKWKNKAWVTARQFTTWFPEHFKPTVQRPAARKKRSPIKILLLIDSTPHHSRIQIEIT